MRTRIRDGSNSENSISPSDAHVMVSLPTSSTSPPPSSLPSHWALSTKQERERVNLYATTGTFILDTEGNRVLTKDHRQENIPSPSKGLVSARERRTLEKE